MSHFVDLLQFCLRSVTLVQVSKATGIPTSHLSEMRLGRRHITPRNDLRLSRYFGRVPGTFLRLQLRDELEDAQANHAAEIETIVPL